MDEKKFFTRMGDGSIVYMTRDEIISDIKAGVDDAVYRGKIDPLTQKEMEYLYEIVTMPGVIVGVEPGRQVVTTNDCGSHKLGAKSMLPISRDVEAMINDRILGCDSVDIGNTDYNYKTVKGVVNREASALKYALNATTMPLFFGGMPNLGFYTKPDGPVDNWATLLPEGKIQEALKAQEEAVGYAVKDIVFVAEQMYAAGADAIQLDTSGAAGDADFLAALEATEIIKKRFPDMAVEIGMAAKFRIAEILGIKINSVERFKERAGLK